MGSEIVDTNLAKVSNRGNIVCMSLTVFKILFFYLYFFYCY